MFSLLYFCLCHPNPILLSVFFPPLYFQFPEKLIPKFINQLPPVAKSLCMNGRNSRNYLYGEDVARAFDIILHRGTIDPFTT